MLMSGCLFILEFLARQTTMDTLVVAVTVSREFSAMVDREPSSSEKGVWLSPQMLRQLKRHRNTLLRQEDLLYVAFPIHKEAV